MLNIKGFAVTKIPIYYGKLWIRYSKDFIADAHIIGIELHADANEFLGLAVRKSNTGASEYLMLIKEDTADIVAHESLHIANYILYDRGISISTENDETQAYLLSWVVTQAVLAKKFLCK